MKKLICWILAPILILSLLLPVFAAPEIAAPSAILVEAATGQTLFEQNAHERLRPASVTKIMTLLLVMEALESGKISWDDTVTASAAAAGKGGSQVYLREGEQMTMEEMLKSVVVASANDCATALAEHVCGSESAFVEEMNRRASELGMLDTHFVNCTGLDDEPDASEHLTSAADIAVMSRELLKHDAIRKYTTIWMDTVRGGEFGLTNTNKLVRFYDGTTGLKTGYTSAAGYCVSASARRDGMELIAVVMHAATSPERFESAKSMLNYGFATYSLYQPEPEIALTAVPVTLGASESVTPVLESTQPLLLEKSKRADIATQTELLPEIAAPVSQGDPLGKLTVTSGAETIAEIPIVAGSDVPRLSWWQVTARLLGAL
ncbi:MAG: D-alanyl-D-alanine carboxypeptidase [Oscillospiraceae bacterium]|nr:D-alanyl-D-alanine carboxypeptidase [Oscillospiraceae bacterium]